MASVFKPAQTRARIKPLKKHHHALAYCRPCGQSLWPIDRMSLAEQYTMGRRYDAKTGTWTPTKDAAEARLNVRRDVTRGTANEV